jgi:hypothetical protein
MVPLDVMKTKQHSSLKNCFSFGLGGEEEEDHHHHRAEEEEEKEEEELFVSIATAPHSSCFCSQCPRLPSIGYLIAEIRIPFVSKLFSKLLYGCHR